MSHPHDHLDQVEVTSHQQLRQWFEQHHSQQDSIWLVTYKKSVPDKYVANTDIVDECVCFAWMDGRKMKLDHQRTMQLLSPKKTPYWALSYKKRYARLLEAGRVHPVAVAQVQADKQSGAWDFMNDVDHLIVPNDLQVALQSCPPAWDHYEAFPDSAKRDILRWIKLAKRSATRHKRIDEIVRKAAHNKRASSTRSD